MAAEANVPITMKEVLTLPSIGIDPQFITFTNVTMESEKYICVRETAPQNNVVIVDMNMPTKPLRLPITADSALMNPNSRILAWKVHLEGTAQDHMQILNIDTNIIVKSHQMLEQVVFWKWITAKKLGLVTQTSVYHWSIEGDSEPVRMFGRKAKLADHQIVNYTCDPSEKWFALIGVAPDALKGEKLMIGHIQIFSVDQQHSRILKGHAAAFALFKVPGNENPSTLICFARKRYRADQITSFLHVIELGAQPGKLPLKKKSDLFPQGDDSAIAIQISGKYSLIYVITKLGNLFLYDLGTTRAVGTKKMTEYPILFCSGLEGYVINLQGKVLLSMVDESKMLSFVNDSFRTRFLSNEEYAGLALHLFGEERKTLDSFYHIVQALGSARIFTRSHGSNLVQDWCHVSFLARQEDSEDEEDIIVFFVEMVDLGHGDGMQLNSYSIARRSCNGINQGCDFCPQDQQHPHIRSMYFAGRNHPIEYDLQQQFGSLFRWQLNSPKRQDLSELRCELVKPEQSWFSTIKSWKSYAQIALDYINEAEEGAEYIFSSTYYAHRQEIAINFTGHAHWVHICFEAELSHDPTSMIFIFAELSDPGIGKFRVTTYDITTSLDEWELGCGMCPISNDIFHPPDALYLAGRWKHVQCPDDVRERCYSCRTQN